MVDSDAVAERGVATASAEVWELAVRRAEVIGRLAAGRVSNLAADAAAAELGLSRRQVYALVRLSKSEVLCTAGRSPLHTPAQVSSAFHGGLCPI